MITLSRTTKRYIIVGGSVYVLELIIIAVATAMGANAPVAVGLSFWIGLLVSFVLQKFITFGDHRTHHKIIIAQAAAYTLLVLFNFAFTLLMAVWLAPFMPAWLARSIALGITTIWNFALYKTKIFMNNDA